MANPTGPHIIGVTLDSNGVAYTKITATNFTTGDTLRVPTDGNKVAIFDCASFDNGYTNGDVLGIENVGASLGGTTVTIDTSSGFQETTLTCAAASTTQVVI